MNKDVVRALLLLALAGAIVLAFAYRDRLDAAALETWVAFTRLVPLFPCNLLNYALGLTRIPLLQYALMSFIFMLPGALAYTYLGYAGREAVAAERVLVF